MADRKRILIVDDDGDHMESLHLVLAREGHRVFAISSGYEAAEVYGRVNPDIVFLDVRMPGIDGFGTFERIRRVDESARVVFMSAYVLEDARYDDATKSRLAVTISKPLSTRLIRKTIKRYAK